MLSWLSQSSYWQHGKKQMNKFGSTALFWMAGILIASLLLLDVNVARADLVPHTAEYKIKISVLGGKLNTHFESTDDGYTAESVIKATGLSRLLAGGEIRERSWFSRSDDRIRPMHYLSSDSISKRGTDVDLMFQWDESLVTGTIGGEDFTTAIENELHDRVSLQYALMHELINGGYSDTYYLQDAEELKVLAVKDMGTEVVKVPYGQFEAIGLQHRAGTSSRVTTLWFAKELGYLPVMIEQHRKGKLQVRAVLTDYVPSAEKEVSTSASW